MTDATDTGEAEGSLNSEKSHEDQERPPNAEESSKGQGSPEGAEETGKSGLSRLGTRSPRRYLLWAAFLLSLLLALISALSLYFQIGSLIGIWIAPEFQPVYRAAFNLAVLLLAFYSALSFAELLGVGE